MRMDQLSGLIALKVVAEKKNFRAAANELRVSPSALSQSIKQLEAKLGVALLSRTTRSTNLTEVGLQFLEAYGASLTQILTAIENVGTYASKPSGLLRLNLPRASYIQAIAPLLSGFQKSYPEISLELFFDDDFANIVDGGFDAGIRATELTEKDMSGLRISKPFKFVVAGSPEYFKKFGKPKHPKELLKHNCAFYRFGNGEYYRKWEFEENQRDFSVEVHGRFVCNDPMIMVDYATKGLGLIYHTDDALQHYIKEGLIELCLEKFAPSSDGYFLYFTSRSQVLPKLRAFIDYIKADKK